ncbi:MAG: hypothetical protein PHR03_04525 [Desulfovibrionales bacterium]|nr:hypothetical protein [Desulfovibrionales bacterium]
MAKFKFDGFVKSPFAALRGILRHCGVATTTPHSSGFVRLATGTFYCAAQDFDFLQINQFCAHPETTISGFALLAFSYQP